MDDRYFKKYYCWKFSKLHKLKWYRQRPLLLRFKRYKHKIEECYDWSTIISYLDGAPRAEKKSINLFVLIINLCYTN